MSELRIEGGHVFLTSTNTHWASIDDAEAWLIRCHNDLQAAREDNDIRPRRQTEQQHQSRPISAQPDTCPDPRCRRLPHPDHANGHLYIGIEVGDRKSRLADALH